MGSGKIISMSKSAIAEAMSEKVEGIKKSQRQSPQRFGRHRRGRLEERKVHSSGALHDQVEEEARYQGDREDDLRPDAKDQGEARQDCREGLCCVRLEESLLSESRLRRKTHALCGCPHGVMCGSRPT